MSEYQYYEFLAVDRPLAEGEMAELRDISSRADITPTRFVNVYNYGDFRGDELAVMEKYFDAFVYVANSGTRRCMFRVPGNLIDKQAAAPYFASDFSDVHYRDNLAILEFRSEEEEHHDWEEGEGWIARLLPLRDEIMDGDLRPLYLGWLNTVNMGELEDDAVEPPVPAGLAKLSGAQRAFVEFLRIDQDLVAVAAEASAPLAPTGSESEELQRWIRALPETEKTELLLHAVEARGLHVRAEVLQRFRADKRRTNPLPSAATGTRTVGQLLAAAEEHAESRKREEARQKALERERRAREEAAKRAKYLDRLVGREEELWREVELLIDKRQAQPYADATQLLVDLRDLANRGGDGAAFERRMRELRRRYAQRPALVKRWNKARL